MGMPIFGLLFPNSLELTSNEAGGEYLMRKSSSQAKLSNVPDTADSRPLSNKSRHSSPGSSTHVVIEHAFEQYNESLVRYLSVRLRSIKDAEEVAQEAYVRLLKLDEPDTISHLQAYLFKIASNIAVDRMRSQSRKPQHIPFDGVTEKIAAPESPLDQRLDAQRQLLLIREIVNELPPKCRKAFLLYKFRGRSYLEIAETMHLTQSMIRKYVLRAIVYCRTRLDEEHKDVR